MKYCKKQQKTFAHHLVDMALKHWKKISEEILVSNRWHDYKRDQFEISDGRKGEYFYIDSAPSAMVVPMLPDGRFVLVRQYRYLWDRESLEFPCGSARYFLSDGTSAHATPEECAVRELKEESGYSGTLTHVGVYNPCNGFGTEQAHVFVGRDLVSGEAEPEPVEEFEIVLLTQAEVEQKIASGEIWDGMTIVGWTLAKPYILK